MYLIQDLISCREYTIQIISIAISKSESNPYQVTLEAKPMPNQKVSFGPSVSTHSITLQITSDDDSLVCEVLFVKAACRTGKNDDIPYKAAEIIIQPSSDVLVYTIEVKPLSPFTEYLCSGTIFNAGGWSDTNEKKLTTLSYCEYFISNKKSPVNLSPKNCLKQQHFQIRHHQET